MARKPKQIKLPQVESKPIMGGIYMTFNSRLNPRTLMTKDQAADKFKEVHNRDPEAVFYGPPNGSLLYAGPVAMIETIDTSKKLRI